MKWARGLALTLAGIAPTTSAGAQPSPAPTMLAEQPLLGSTLGADIVRDLPTGNSPFTLLETIQPETISNLVAAGGLNGATAPQVGGLLNSWTQTQFRIGDLTITDPRSGGTPLLLPVLPLWARISTATGAMGVDDNASALSITLAPPRPGAAWRRAVEGSVSGSFLVSERSGPVPAVDRVHRWQDGSLLVSGPITERVGLVVSGAWRGLSRVTAPSANAASERLSSGFAHLVFAASPRDEIRAIGWAQQVTTAESTDNSVHLQTTWERHDPAGLAWRAFGGYTQRTRTAPQAATLVVDSLVSDPVSDLIDGGTDTSRRWAVGARLAPTPARRLPAVGIDLEGAQVRIAATGPAQIRELLNGAPARVWTIHPGPGSDVRQRTSLAVFGNEHLTTGRLTLDAGVRLDTVSGEANGAVRGIHWTTWLPSAKARWQITRTADVAVVASYRRTAYQLPLNVLAVGDPAAPVADVSAWNAASDGPLIARVGPGTGGDNALTQIDPHVQRPTTDELVLALVSRPVRWLQLELARITKREQPLLGLVDTGVAASSYAPFPVPDPSFLPDSPVGAPLVTAYDRPAGAYGRDRYVLTNRATDPARSWGLEAIVRVTADRFTLLAGGNLTWALGPAAAIGVLPSQNDQDVLGNFLVDPNTTTAARGQLFQDRSHVVKIAGIYRFPGRVSLGATARYQDGQPFARLVIAPGLAQGPTAVRSYANGGSAFTYTATLDVRAQKTFAVGRREVTAVLDVYNLTNLDNELTEYVVTGPAFRTPTTLQPPRTALLGMRVMF